MATLRYTIGTGCSGGSLAQYWIANAYPGVYQGILPTCSFPDAWTSAIQVADYALLEHYFFESTLTGGAAWSPSQEAAVEGIPTTANAFLSVGCTNFNPPYTPATCPTGFFYGAVPYWPCPGVTSQQLYNAQTNPGGVRCSIADLAKNLLGPERPSVWSPAEKKIGHGFAGMPFDNVGVQYGLAAMRDGAITPAQFVDLNTHIGGADIDLNPVPQRRVADQPALANAYRTGLINEANNLNETAIIDCRGPNPGLAHDAYRAFAVRERLDRDFGTHANQVIWEGPEPLEADSQCELNSFIAMDHWLTAIVKDKRKMPLAKKIIRDKPAGLGDECWNGSGQKVSNGLCPPGVVPVYGTPRTVAGDPITTDANKCQLQPLNRSAYLPVQFTDAEWSRAAKHLPQRSLQLQQTRCRPAAHSPVAHVSDAVRQSHLRRPSTWLPAGIHRDPTRTVTPPVKSSASARCPIALRRLGVEGQPERTPLGVPTDRPPRPGMDNAPAQRFDPAERRVHVRDREVGERDRVAGAGAALVDADGGIAGVCLPAAALGLAALG